MINVSVYVEYRLQRHCGGFGNKQPLNRSDSTGTGKRVSVKGRYNTNFKEFDPGSGRTLAARLTHASRTVTVELVPLEQWRTGE